MKITLRIISLMLTAVIFFSTAGTSLAQSENETYQDQKGLAIKGYDAVAYHTEGTPVKGAKEFEFEWKGAKWLFASAENMTLFKADPEKYAPQYGGYCAWAVSRGYIADTDPRNAWRIVEGKLYLNYNSSVQKNWERDIPGNTQKADANWPKVLR